MRISLLISTESLSARARRKLLRQFAVYTILSGANVSEPLINTRSVKFNSHTFIYTRGKWSIDCDLEITPHSSAYWHASPANQPIPQSNDTQCFKLKSCFYSAPHYQPMARETPTTGSNVSMTVEKVKVCGMSL